MHFALKFITAKTYTQLALGATVITTVVVTFLMLGGITYDWAYYQLNKPSPEIVRTCQSIHEQCLDEFIAESDSLMIAACKLKKQSDLGIHCTQLGERSWLQVYKQARKHTNLFNIIWSLSITAAFALWVAKYIAILEHAGWRRISIVVGVVGSLAALRILWDEYDNEEIFFLWVTCTLAFFLAPTALIRVYAWICNGFDHQPKPIDQANTKAERVEEQQRRSSPARPVTWEPATFGNRFFARCLDVVIVYIIVNLLTFFIPDIPTAGDWFLAITFINLLVSYAVVCAVFYFYDVYFLSKFGTSPGKLALGLRVESRNHLQQLTRADAKVRTLRFLSEGLFYMLFFPLIQFVALIQAWRRRDTQQPWDEACGTRVVQKEINSIRSILVKVLALVLICSLLVITQAMKVAVKSDLRNTTHQNYLR